MWRKGDKSPTYLGRTRGSVLHRPTHPLGSLAGLGGAYGRVLGSGPGVAHAMDDRDCAEDCDDPEDGGHAVEESSEDDQDQAFGAFHEADAAFADQAFGAGAGVADHDGADHDEGGEHDVEEAVAAGVEDEQAEELRRVTVAVDDGVEEGSEAGDAVGGAGDFSVDEIEESGKENYQAGVKEQMLLRHRVGGAEQDCRPGVYDESHEGEHVGIDARQGEPADDGLEEHSAGAAEGAGPASPSGSF